MSAMYATEELSRWVTEAQRGDEQAFARLVRRYRGMAYSAAAGYLRDRDQVQDVAQEAFLEAYVNLPSLKEPAAFGGWFRQILFRRCVRRVRKSRLSTLPLDAALEVAAREPGPEQCALSNEFELATWRAIRELPAHEQATLHLFMRGLSYAQIGVELEVPISTVKKRLHTARGRLRERLFPREGWLR